MTINPIIPLPVAAVICVGLIACKRKGVWPFIRQIIIILLLFTVNLRIKIPNYNAKVTVVELKANVVFLIDDTLSMLANDCEGGQKRLDMVKKDCAHIIEKLMGSDFSVISFSNSAVLLCPFNDDVLFVNSIVNSIYPPNQYSAEGTNLAVGKDQALAQLKNARERGGYTVFFYISDGEDNKNTKEYGFEELAQYIDAGAVLGYGTEKGGEMYVDLYYSDVPEPITTYSYGTGTVNAVSKMDPANLQKIANQLGISYNAMPGYGSLDRMLDDVIANVETGVSEKVGIGYDETYYYFAIALLVMLVLECFFTKKQLLSKRL